VSSPSAARRKAKRESKAVRARRQKIEAAVREEEKAEAIAPAAQRKDITNAAGEVVYAARLQRDGVTFIRSNPIKRMYELGKNKGPKATVKEKHLAAVVWLVRIWEDGAEGIGSVPSLMGERTSRSVTTGWISPHVLEALNRQIRARDQFAAAQTWLGSHWPCIRRIALEGADVAVWADETGRNRDKALGFLEGALERLHEVYTRLELGGDEAVEMEIVR
jgi:hypothetical protein